jgi:hypothetical protein
MARMLPENISDDAPVSEKRVFELLRSSPGTRDWTVFHSLGLSSAYTGTYGEIDFVLSIPGRGLLCLEVKGGRVECRSGTWSSTDRNGVTHAYRRSPFQQAREGMFKLLSAIRNRFGDGSEEVRCPVGWAVMLTDCAAPPPSPEFQRGEVLDSMDFQQSPIGKLEAVPSLVQALERTSPPTALTMASLSRFLRPDFDRVATAATTLWEAERQFISLTEEQYDVLDHVIENEASLISGGAGTGKTMVAVELARRLSAMGRSVLLTCYNRELGSWLSGRCRGFGPGHVTAGHLHGLLEPRIRAAGLLETVSGSGSREAWLEAGALAIVGGEERFDTVIVDEAQDFPAHLLLDLVEGWRRERAPDPGICLFADYSRQAVYASPEGARDLIRRRLRPAVFTLRRNCRNSRRIAMETAALIGSFDVSSPEEQSPGPSVERVFFDREDQQLVVLNRTLQALRAEGFNGTDIVVLGPRARGESVLAGTNSCGGYRIVDRGDRNSESGVIYSTVQSFKGLESPAVVLVDLHPQEDHETDALLYVGMTRARVRLTMLLPETARAEISRRERVNLMAALS